MNENKTFFSDFHKALIGAIVLFLCMYAIFAILQGHYDSTGGHIYPQITQPDPPPPNYEDLEMTNIVTISLDDNQTASPECPDFETAMLDLDPPPPYSAIFNTQQTQ